jgi:hypothetical protein
MPTHLRYASSSASASSGLRPIFSLVTSLGSTRRRPAGSRSHAGARNCCRSRARVGPSNIRAAQRSSRHRGVRALERYDDSREDLAGQLARRLAEDAG